MMNIQILVPSTGLNTHRSYSILLYHALMQAAFTTQVADPIDVVQTDDYAKCGPSTGEANLAGLVWDKHEAETIAQLVIKRIQARQRTFLLGIPQDILAQIMRQAGSGSGLTACYAKPHTVEAKKALSIFVFSAYHAHQYKSAA